VRISNAKARSRISRPNRNKPKTQLLRASARLRAVFAYGKTSSGLRIQARVERHGEQPVIEASVRCDFTDSPLRQPVRAPNSFRTRTGSCEWRPPLGQREHDRPLSTTQTARRSTGSVVRIHWHWDALHFSLTRRQLANAQHADCSKIPSKLREVRNVGGVNDVTTLRGRGHDDRVDGGCAFDSSERFAGVTKRVAQRQRREHVRSLDDAKRKEQPQNPLGRAVKASGSALAVMALFT